MQYKDLHIILQIIHQSTAKKCRRKVNLEISWTRRFQIILIAFFQKAKKLFFSMTIVRTMLSDMMLEELLLSRPCNILTRTPWLFLLKKVFSHETIHKFCNVYQIKKVALLYILWTFPWKVYRTKIVMH